LILEYFAFFSDKPIVLKNEHKKMFQVGIPATFWREDEESDSTVSRCSRKSDGRVYLRRLGVVN